MKGFYQVKINERLVYLGKRNGDEITYYFVSTFGDSDSRVRKSYEDINTVSAKSQLCPYFKDNTSPTQAELEMLSMISPKHYEDVIKIMEYLEEQQ